ncbi:Stress responsive alpha-beta barrel [Cinnamomum micranthum f. kanehirae]|uniref:Stress responsive alpha-beta barrel n=1 Tax=Cinnamomum micranthum f. kanehirae TaxID=337451 RepID=A0A443NV04_9MAGN|nr:Stress responsive alpha-beta barrel [Cinnamomum micranthum f. kanehirae]
MGSMTHLVVAKFKEGVVMGDIKKGVEKMASQIDCIKSFEWGEDFGSNETLRKGFTHALLVTFESSEGFHAYLSHPAHVEFGAIFRAAAENYLVLDFPTDLVKSPRPKK